MEARQLWAEKERVRARKERWTIGWRGWKGRLPNGLARDWTFPLCPSPRSPVCSAADPQFVRQSHGGLSPACQCRCHRYFHSLRTKLQIQSRAAFSGQNWQLYWKLEWLERECSTKVQGEVTSARSICVWRTAVCVCACVCVSLVYLTDWNCWRSPELTN